MTAQPPPFPNGESESRRSRTAAVIGTPDRTDFDMAVKQISQQLEGIRRTMIDMVQESRRQQDETLRYLKKIAWNTFWVALVVFIMPAIVFIFWLLVLFAAVAQ